MSHRNLNNTVTLFFLTFMVSFCTANQSISLDEIPSVLNSLQVVPKSAEFAPVEPLSLPIDEPSNNITPEPDFQDDIPLTCDISNQEYVEVYHDEEYDEQMPQKTLQTNTLDDFFAPFDASEKQTSNQTDETKLFKKKKVKVKPKVCRRLIVKRKKAGPFWHSQKALIAALSAIFIASAGAWYHFGPFQLAAFNGLNQPISKAFPAQPTPEPAPISLQLLMIKKAKVIFATFKEVAKEIFAIIQLLMQNETPTGETPTNDTTKALQQQQKQNNNQLSKPD